MENQKHLFNLPEDISYLNCAYMSPLLKSVAQVGTQGVFGKEDPTTISASDFFDNTRKLREAFGKLLNASSPDQCAIVPSVSYGLANVAKNLKAGKGDNIVVADEQFPSNIYAWKELEKERGIFLKIVKCESSKERGKTWNERVLEAIDSNTKMVATGHVHWADGTKFDLKAIRQRAHDVGAILVIDGTQSIGALPFDIQDIKPDAVVAAGYKWLMGPYSSGVAYYGDYFRDGKPVENNWMNRLNSHDFKNLVNYQEEYQKGAVRYEVGESANFILTPMLTKAIEQINEWQPENIQSYCKEIAKDYISEFKALGIELEDETYRGHHLFGLRLPKNASIDTISEKLKSEHIHVSVRGTSIRVAPHLYNTQDDFAKLYETLKTSL